MQQERGQAMLRAAGARRLTRTLSRCPTRAKNSPEKCLEYLGRESHWALRPRRLVVVHRSDNYSYHSDGLRHTPPKIVSIYALILYIESRISHTIIYKP